MLQTIFIYESNQLVAQKHLRAIVIVTVKVTFILHPLLNKEYKMKNSTTFHNNLFCSTDKVGDHDSSDDHVSDDIEDIKDEHTNDDDTKMKETV